MRKLPLILLVFLVPAFVMAAWVLQATNQTNGIPGVWREPTKGIVYYGSYPPGVNTFSPTPTWTFTGTPTNTAVNASTPTFTPSATFTLSFTNTVTGSPTATFTPTGTFTAVYTNTPAIPINPAGVGFPIVDARISGISDMAIAIDSLGNLYVSDINQIIAEYDADGNFVKQIGQCCGGANGDFGGGDVDGLVCDANDNLWASDDTNGRIIKWNTKSGQWMQNLGVTGNQIYGIAIGPSTGNIYVADYANNRVRVYTAGGAVSTSWSTNNGLAPFGICLDSTETWAYCSVPTTVEKHTIAGTFVGNYGSASPPFNFSTPQGLWTDFQNNIYVADPSAGLVTRLTSNGVFLNQWGQGLQVIGSLMYSEFVVGDVYGGIYISDPQLERIVKTSNKGYPLAHCCGKY
jgi:hypothetical protein